MQSKQAQKTKQNDRSTEQKQNLKSFVTEIVSVLIKKEWKAIITYVYKFGLIESYGNAVNMDGRRERCFVDRRKSLASQVVTERVS